MVLIVNVVRICRMRSSLVPDTNHQSVASPLPDDSSCICIVVSFSRFRVLLRAQVGDMLQLPFENASFDAVIGPHNCLLSALLYAP